MKKSVIFVICIVIIVVAIFWTKYINYKSKISEIKESNLEYEVYLNTEITGTELTSVINKAVDNNEKNSVEKGEDGIYVENDTNSVKIDIKMLDDEGNIYQMETVYNGGMVNFLTYYSDINFECTNIEYNSEGRVKYLLFEQKTT